MLWGRPLRSIFARFNNKKLSFKFNHLETTDEITIEQDLVTKSKKIQAHDKDNKCKIGDTVEIIEAKPISKKKKFEVVY